MNSKELDQYYTKEIIAKVCYEYTLDFLNQHNIVYDLWLEPSAGTGSFFKLLPSNRIGIDLNPKFPRIFSHDFFTFPLPEKKYVTIGNPPFGKNSSLAIKFFNKCAEKSVIIAFIVPKTFKKASITRTLNEYFHLEFEYDLPTNSFIFEDEEYDVPCVFQIWVKKEIKRDKIKFLNKHVDFEFVSKINGNYAIQRVGVNAGRVKTNFIDCAAPSHYFIKSSEEVRKIFENIDWSSVKYNTAGNPSISKHELITLYNNYKTS